MSQKSTSRAASRAARRAQQMRKRKVKRYVLRTLICVATALVLLVGGALATVGIVIRGPSSTASDLFVISALETSAMKFVPKMFLSSAEIDAVRERNSVVDVTEDTNTELVQVATSEPAETDAEAEVTPDIEVIDINGPTFLGKMMIVKDPARVTVGTCGQIGAEGKTLMQIYNRYEALGAINGGAFVDVNGQGSGGTPDGIVVSGGKVLWEKVSDSYEVKTVIGFDKDDKLVFTNRMSSDYVKKLRMRDAVSFGPVLISNGKPVTIKGTSSGMNPRSAIGQRADGAVLLLVVDGRKVNSMGATLADLIDVMLEHDAVNAANLDGGSSSYLIYEGKYQNVGSSLTGPRGMATAFIVK